MLMEQRLILPVKHYKQHSDWDCGLTCLRMLSDFYHFNLTTFDELVHSYDCNQSTWTIDLLYLLKKMNIAASLSTMTLGCSEAFNDMAYYKSLIKDDRIRVDRLFTELANEVKLGSRSWKDLKQHLIEQRKPCLVLIDAAQLQCLTCQKSTVDRIYNAFILPFFSSYQGHYILVIGFISENEQDFIRYVDPAKNDGFCTTTEEIFDRARKVVGTDEDIIWCYERLDDTSAESVR